MSKLVATDLSEAIAWYADHRCLRLPASPEELTRAERLLGPIGGLIITQPDARERWRRLIDNSPELRARVTDETIIRTDNAIQADFYRLGPPDSGTITSPTSQREAQQISGGL